MKGNDLDNVVTPRDVVVFEGLLGLLPDKRVAAQEAKYRAKGKWDYAVACYEINEMLARKIWDLVWRGHYRLDLLTYHGHEFAVALEKRIERENLPFAHVWSEQPNILARRLAVQPDIRTIYDPNPEHRFTYGQKGRVLMPDQYNVLGAL